MEVNTTLIGIVPEDKMEGLVSLENVNKVINEALCVIYNQLPSFYQPFLKALKLYTTESVNIDIQTIFKALDHRACIDDLDAIVQSRDTYTNLKLIKVSLFLYAKRKLTLIDIRHGVVAFGMCDYENSLNGISAKCTVV